MSDSVAVADRFGATDPRDEWSGAGRTVERLFPFVDVAITMTLLLGETAGERQAIPAHTRRAMRGMLKDVRCVGRL